MSQTPDTEKIPFGQTTAAKAAAIALALVASLLLAAFLIATLPGKHAGWENALPTPAMSAPDAEAALLRARYLHEATVRPELIRAGFFSPDDAGAPRGRDQKNRGEEPSSRQLTDALWTFRAFPGLHAEFLAMLLDAKSDPKERVKNFYLYGEFLAAIADAIADGRSRQYRVEEHDGRYVDTGMEWSASSKDEPRLTVDKRSRARRDSRTPQKTTLFAERLAFARAILPGILAEVKKDVETRTALAAGEKPGKGPEASGEEAWGKRRDRDRYLEELNRSITEAVRVLWEKRADAAFATLAREIVAREEGSLGERYDLIPLAAEKPGLPASEYFFWRKYKDDLASVTSCVGTDPVFYAYLLGCMDKLMTETTNQLKSRGTFMLSGHTGPGVTLARTDAFTPRRNLSGRLYLLADMALAMEKEGVPEYDLSRAYPIFQGTLYRHMERQPLVLPLNPANPKDAALIDWYAQTGWKEDRTLLFSAVGSPEDVARHWALVHLLWWESDGAEKDDGASLAYLHPESGHFMSGMLPALKGKAVARFLGPVTVLWFGIRNVDENGWVDEKFEARPEVPPAVPTVPRTPPRSPILDWFTGAKPETTERTPTYSETTATILIDGDVRSALSKSYSRNDRMQLARTLDEKRHDPATPPREIVNFVVTTCDELSKWNIEGRKDAALALEYLWQFRDDADIDAKIRGILSQEDLRPHERMRTIRQVLGLTEKKGS